MSNGCDTQVPALALMLMLLQASCSSRHHALQLQLAHAEGCCCGMRLTPTKVVVR